MCPSESEIFDSVLDNAVELDEEPKRPVGGILLTILLFLPRLLLRIIAWPLRWLGRGMQP